MKTLITILIVIMLGFLGLAFYLVAGHKIATAPTPSVRASASPTSNASASPQASSSSAAIQSVSAVTVANMAFSPADITVKKGTTVAWTNQDSVTHTVTEDDGQPGPASGALANGQRYAYTYNTAGTFKYHCTIHPNMTGTVTVIE
jgi:plastocyanin